MNKIDKPNHTGETPQQSLRSIARRVLQRQLASITKEGSDLPPGQQACIYRINMYKKLDVKSAEKNSCSEFDTNFNELVEIKSPNGAYTLYMHIKTPTDDNWQGQNFTVAILATENKSNLTKTIANHDFMLTWFDFPFTDNTRLADGTRFSLVINAVDAEAKEASFNLVWFPQDYFSARERPINHRQFREKLGITLNQ